VGEGTDDDSIIDLADRAGVAGGQSSQYPLRRHRGGAVQSQKTACTAHASSGPCARTASFRINLRRMSRMRRAKANSQPRRRAAQQSRLRSGEPLWLANGQRPKQRYAR
jgi:hypothetical protein